MKDYAYITVSTFTRVQGDQESSNLMQHLQEGFTIMFAVGTGNGVVHYVLERDVYETGPAEVKVDPYLESKP